MFEVASRIVTLFYRLEDLNLFTSQKGLMVAKKGRRASSGGALFYNRTAIFDWEFTRPSFPVLKASFLCRAKQDID